MEDKKIEITLGKKKYLIEKFLIDRLNDLNVTIDEDYYKYISQYKNPYSSSITDFDAFQLLNCDFWNRILYDSERGLGNVLVYDKEGNIMGEYPNLTELLLAVNENGLSYGFRNLHDKGIIPSKHKIDFYGVQMTYSNQHPYLDTLIKLVKDINNWRNGKRSENAYNDEDRKSLRKWYSFETFKLHKVKYWSFMLGDYEANTRRNMKEEKEVVGTEEEYKNQLKNLFDRYSLDGVCGFEEVKDLNLVHKYTGIYLLCFDDEKKYYIGQAKSSFKDRIIQHFTRPNSQFDETHKPTDVSRIYVLHTTDEFIDYVEMDCIASINKDYLLNCLAGGHSIMSITQDDYDPDKYKFSKKFLKMILESVPEAKRFNKNDIEWDNYLKKGKEVIRKFKSLKEENRTKELCEEVLGYDGNMLIYVPLKHKNPEMCLRAFEYGDFEEVFKGIPKEFLTEDFIIELIHINRRVTKLLPKELKTDKVMEVAGYRKKK